MNTFPNSAKIIVHEFFPALRYFSFINISSLPPAHIRCTLGCICFMKYHFHAVVTSSSIEIKQNHEIFSIRTRTFPQGPPNTCIPNKLQHSVSRYEVRTHRSFQTLNSIAQFLTFCDVTTIEIKLIYIPQTCCESFWSGISNFIQAQTELLYLHREVKNWSNIWRFSLFAIWWFFFSKTGIAATWKLFFGDRH